MIKGTFENGKFYDLTKSTSDIPSPMIVSGNSSGPSLYIDREIPALDGVEVGSKINLRARAKLISVSEDDDLGKRYTVEITDIAIEAGE